MYQFSTDSKYQSKTGLCPRVSSSNGARMPPEMTSYVNKHDGGVNDLINMQMN